MMALGPLAFAAPLALAGLPGAARAVDAAARHAAGAANRGRDLRTNPPIAAPRAHAGDAADHALVADRLAAGSWRR
jgi:hypothetical protein